MANQKTGKGLPRSLKSAKPAAATVQVAADATSGIAAGDLQATLTAMAARIKVLESA
ncbi:hypothetical protein HX787_08080 [Pseudomonas tolaasii]|uniref:Uncharacterized protein n=1 Tax=Pseudomonas tolaasii TaxID=29442 RepID=A0A7Y8DQ24_PSETO|nr:hypothetical protein [Pseudomonas tolaasii]NWC20351.1 hypothetical protein [Pseudomonas tolaasii]NWC38353.1 hypothetical protein [Pseudomonas tolaasii]NWD35812.1 hypothetical protein [Pseudomonas tolaasii]